MTDERDQLIAALQILANRTLAESCPQWAIDEAYDLAAAAITRATGREATRENHFGLVEGARPIPDGGPGYDI